LALSQARPIGGLHRTSALPFRISFFTLALHPARARIQRLIAHLIWAMELLAIAVRSFYLDASWRTLTSGITEPKPRGE
jgi:hypothetical protein